MKENNILVSLLRHLQIKFTKAHAHKLYDQQPQRDTLFGISQMLFDYNIPNRAVRMKDKNELKTLNTPFVVGVEGHNVLVTKQTKEKVYFIWDNEEKDIPIDDFIKAWDGVVLIPQKTEKSIEPDYEKNIIQQWYQTVRKRLTIISVILLFLIGFISNNIYSDLGLSLLFIVNLAGSYIGYLLVQKQLYIKNKHADKICSLFKKDGGCNDVLQSSAAKFLGVIGWSEVGLGYFISNMLISAFVPSLIVYLALVNICALPYSFWSVWYQRFKVKQWCPLCLAVQILLWFVFIVNFIFGFIYIPEFLHSDILLVGIAYIILFSVISILLPKFIAEKQVQMFAKEFDNLRMKPEVFEAQLKQQKHYEIDQSVSSIIWGNRNAKKQITIVLSPYCGYCAAIHKQVEKLLDKAGNMICIQYVFTVSEGDAGFASRFLTGVYLSDIDIEKKRKIYNEWYEEGAYHPDAFFEKYKIDIDNQIVEEEIEKHKAFRERIDIYGTPTVFLNGYELPNYYRIEDVIYFPELEIEKSR